MNKKRWWALAIFVVFIVIWATTASNFKPDKAENPAGFMGYLNNMEKQQINRTDVYQEGTGKTLAMLELEGVITENASSSALGLESGYNHQIFLKQIEAAFARDDIKGVILKINSPGGGVYESDEIYMRLMEMKKTYRKPLVVYMSQQAASGGYYVAMAADRIYANRNTITGSIGVILQSYNFEQLANKVGIKDVTFKSGSQKDLLNPMRPMNDQESQIIQALINESYGFFVDVVAKGRNMDRNIVLQLADGRIYTGTQAKNLGLIDEVGYLDQAIAGAAKLAGTSDPRVIVFRKPGPDVFSWLSMRAPALDLLGIKQQLEMEVGPELMYLAR